MSQKPDFHIFRQNVTRYWSDNIQSRVEKLYAVYIFDANIHFHACELTPSYVMNYLGPTWEGVKNEDDDEKLAEEIMDGASDSNEVEYVHVKDVNLDKCKTLSVSDSEWEAFLEEADNDSDEAYRLCLEKKTEYCQCNGYVY